MDALDLTKRPPRAPRELLPGLNLLMIARTVDKLRATLPGGNPGEYKISGFSDRTLKALGIEEAALLDAVAAAKDDAEIAAWVAANSDAARYDEVNATLATLKIADRIGDPAFAAKYPIYAQLPPETALIDALVEDDRAAFPLA
jgi:Domain of unknown function (DUF5069)